MSRSVLSSRQNQKILRQLMRGRRQQNNKKKEEEEENIYNYNYTHYNK